MSTRLSVTSKSVHVDTVLADANPIPYGDTCFGIVLVPAGSAITLISWYVGTSSTGDFFAAFDGGAAITSACAASRAVPIPHELAGARWLKAVGDADGTVDICMKG